MAKNQQKQLEKMAQDILNQTPEQFTDDLITMLFLNVFSKKGLHGLVWIADNSVSVVGFAGKTKEEAFRDALEKLSEVVHGSV